MSVEKSKRSTPKLDCAIKAQKVVKQILLITQNERKWTPTYRALTEDVIHTSERIFVDIWKANNIFAKGEENIKKRIELENMAIAETYNLLALMDLAYSTFHLDSKSVEYVTKLVIEARDSIKGFREGDKKRLK